MREGLHKIVSTDETIVAISTPSGRSAIGVVRLSGLSARSIVETFFKSSKELQHRGAVWGRWHGRGGEVRDEVIATYFHAPESYTGEDMVEISAHGNPVILSQIMADSCGVGARVASPGEFTLRAMMHGKMDLIQAEAVREFIEAQTEGQAKMALRQMEGSISRQIRPIKTALIDIIAGLEAGIDFAEDDVEVPGEAMLIERIRPLSQSLSELQATFGYGALLAAGCRLAIVGKPNVGKSSLFNRFVGKDRAIVTEVPGTTRDVLTETIQLGGIPLRFSDTAGVRTTSDHVESLGVGRTFEVIAEANLILVVLDGASELDEDDRRVLSKVRGLRHIVVLNKRDLPQVVSSEALVGSAVAVSAKTGEGFAALQDAIQGFLLDQKTELADDSVITSARQNEAILKACESLNAAIDAFGKALPHELALLDLYGALAALNEMTGDTVTEDILDRIFSSFCIGK